MQEIDLYTRNEGALSAISFKAVRTTQSQFSFFHQSKACWRILTVPGVRESINLFLVFCLITCTFTHAAIYKMLADQYVNRSYPGTDEIIHVARGLFPSNL